MRGIIKKIAAIILIAAMSGPALAENPERQSAIDSYAESFYDYLTGVYLCQDSLGGYDTYYVAREDIQKVFELYLDHKTAEATILKFDAKLKEQYPNPGQSFRDGFKKEGIPVTESQLDRACRSGVAEKRKAVFDARDKLKRLKLEGKL